jgi:RimJ/RimL family protein N-acetyltransferase
MEEIAIRRATADDAAALAAFGARTFAAAFSADNQPHHLEAYLAGAYSEATQLAEIQSSRTITLIAHCATTFAGFVQLDREPVPSDSAYAGPPVDHLQVELKRFYVDQPWQGSGLADRLMRSALDAAKELGAGPIWLGVWERNPRAIRFYQRHGFVAVGNKLFDVGGDLQRDCVMVRDADGGQALCMTESVDIPRLCGNGLTLRGMTDQDATALVRTWGDPEVMRFMARAPLADIDEAKVFIAEIDEGAAAQTLLQWGIHLDGESEIVGTVTLMLTDLEHETAEIGFALQRDRWGQGIVSRAAPLVVDFAFANLAVHRLQADCDPRNPGSLRVLEKLGFQRDGVLRERYLQLGERQDAVILSLIATDRDRH